VPPNPFTPPIPAAEEFFTIEEEEEIEE